MATLSVMAPRTCTRCLYVEGMGLDFLPRVLPHRLVKDMAIAADGVCSLCRAYARDFDAAAVDRERDELLCHSRGAPVVVALSGGKDSLSTLWLARRVLALEVRAVLLDNGFIPAAVLEVARAACARLDVPLTITALAGDERASFASLVAGDAAGTILPCGACSRYIERALVDVARDAGARMLLLGTNFFASWGKRPSSITSSGASMVLHLPYALGVKRADVESHLDALGVRPVAGLLGSTNCRVPGLMQSRAKTRGHTIDVEDLLLEVLVGHLTRDEALRRARPADT